MLVIIFYKNLLNFLSLDNYLISYSINNIFTMVVIIFYCYLEFIKFIFI